MSATEARTSTMDQRTVAAPGLAALAALVFEGMDQPVELIASLPFTPLRAGGRVGVDVHNLYTTAQTGPDGPAASIVRYHPGASAAPHRHTGYEIIYVLAGELITEAGRHGPHTMLVMPPGSVHAPRTERGALMLVVWEAPVQPV